MNEIEIKKLIEIRNAILKDLPLGCEDVKWHINDLDTLISHLSQPTPTSEVENKINQAIEILSTITTWSSFSDHPLGIAGKEAEDIFKSIQGKASPTRGISSEDVKRWYAILVGKGEAAMYDDIYKKKEQPALSGKWDEVDVVAYAEAYRFSSGRISISQFKEMIKENEANDYKKTAKELIADWKEQPTPTQVKEETTDGVLYEYLKSMEWGEDNIQDHISVFHKEVVTAFNLWYDNTYP